MGKLRRSNESMVKEQRRKSCDVTGLFRVWFLWYRCGRRGRDGSRTLLVDRSRSNSFSGTSGKELRIVDKLSVLVQQRVENIYSHLLISLKSRRQIGHLKVRESMIA